MIRVAVIGLGWWGKQIVTCLRESARLRIVTAHDANPPSVAGFAAEQGVELATSFHAVLHRADVDAVAIVTPHALHEEQVLLAAAAGKHVFCEKPLALSGAAAKRMLDACARAERVLGIGHERRYEPAMEEVARLCTRGDLGRVIHLDANVSHDIFRALDASNWRLSKENAPAGAMTALGIHLTDMFISLAGTPVRVTARTARHVFSPPADDFVAFDLEFSNGVSARVTCISATPFYGRFTVYGDAGWVEVQEGGNVDKGLPSVLVHADRSGARTTRAYAPANTVLANFEAWADAIEGRAPYRFTPEQLLANVQVLEAVIRSAENGGAPVTIT
jgi:predicted dehydrogenase